MKTTLLLALLLCTFAQAQQFSSIPSSSIAMNGLEYEDGPTAKINMAEVEGIKQYAVNANNDINILLKLVSQLSDVSQIKSKLFTGIERIISQSKDSRSILLLTHSLQAGMTLVKLIDKVAVSKGPAYTPEGTIRQQVRIMKQSLKFAQDYYESDQTFINGVMVKNEVKTNPQFVEFGVKLNAFLIKLSDGLLNAQASYGTIRWSLGVLGHYIQEDKISGLNYSATLYNLANTLQGKDPSTGFSIYPDLVNLEQGEVAPTDAECILKIRDLKLLYQVSMEGIQTAKEKLEKDKLDYYITNDGHKVLAQKQMNADKTVTFKNIQYNVDGKNYPILSDSHSRGLRLCRALNFSGGSVGFDEHFTTTSQNMVLLDFGDGVYVKLAPWTKYISEVTCKI